jgi:hypothetical protein
MHTDSTTTGSAPYINHICYTSYNLQTIWLAEVCFWLSSLQQSPNSTQNMIEDIILDPKYTSELLTVRPSPTPPLKGSLRGGAYCSPEPLTTIGFVLFGVWTREGEFRPNAGEGNGRAEVEERLSKRKLTNTRPIMSSITDTANPV